MEKTNIFSDIWMQGFAPQTEVTLIALLFGMNIFSLLTIIYLSHRAAVQGESISALQAMVLPSEQIRSIVHKECAAVAMQAKEDQQSLKLAVEKLIEKVEDLRMLVGTREQDKK